MTLIESNAEEGIVCVNIKNRELSRDNTSMKTEEPECFHKTTTLRTTVFGNIKGLRIAVEII